MVTRRELNLAIFEGTADRVLWQPRLETWIGHHDHHGSMPERFRGLSSLEIYDKLQCSVRYAACAGLESYNEPDDIESFSEDPDREHHVEGTRVPEGELRTVHRRIWHGDEVVNSRIEGFSVKTADDLRVLTALVERRRFRVNTESFRKAEAAVGHRAEPTMFLSSDGFTELIKFWAGLENACYLLADHPAEVDAYMDACARSDDRMLDEIFKLPCRLFNLGDHTTNEFTPPPIIERYCLRRWQKISRRMTEHGCFVHSHWDGNSRHILRYLKPSGLHAVEALTPEPMGDMTLEMIKEAVGDEIVVLDLIPAIFFLPNHPMNDLLEFTRRVIDMFAPRLILGVSDEISQVGEIEKIEAVGELVDNICGLAT